jgi:PAS domain-containing protein
MDSRIVLRDGSVKHVKTVGHPVFNASGDLTEFIGVVMDTTERKRSEEALRDAQAELARVARATTMGELTASIAHEVNQPLAAVVTNAGACVRWLAAETPDLGEARAAAREIARDANRASDVIARIRGLLKKGEPVTVKLSVNDIVREIITLTQGEVLRREASLLMELADGLPAMSADRVQLQQLLLNLMMNALDATSAVTDRPRVLLWLAPLPPLALGGVALTGFGFALVFPALGTEAVQSFPPQNRGSALGAYTAFVDLSLGICGPMAGVIVSELGIFADLSLRGAARWLGSDAVFSPLSEAFQEFGQRQGDPGKPPTATAKHGS